MTHASRNQRGAILMEVVLALTIFVVAATILHGALSASMLGVGRLRQENVATDLAVTRMSELMLAPDVIEAEGPYEFTDDEGDTPEWLAGWTWEVQLEAVSTSDPEAPEMNEIVVIIRHESGVTRTLTRLLPVPPPELDTEAEMEGGP